MLLWQLMRYVAGIGLHGLVVDLTLHGVVLPASGRLSGGIARRGLLLWLLLHRLLRWLMLWLLILLLLNLLRLLLLLLIGLALAGFWEEVAIPGECLRDRRTDLAAIAFDSRRCGRSDLVGPLGVLGALLLQEPERRH